MNEISDKEIIDILKENELKVTPQRLAICKVILSSESHPSVEEIYNIIQKNHPMISIATVYKTVSLLQKIGKVSEIKINETHTRYDPKTTLHINMVCPICKEIYDYESELLRRNWNNIISEVEGEIIGQRIDLYKICRKCKS